MAACFLAEIWIENKEVSSKDCKCLGASGLMASGDLRRSVTSQPGGGTEPREMLRGSIWSQREWREDGIDACLDLPAVLWKDVMVTGGQVPSAPSIPSHQCTVLETSGCIFFLLKKRKVSHQDPCELLKLGLSQGHQSAFSPLELFSSPILC